MSDRALATMSVPGLFDALAPLTRPIVLEHVIKGRVVGVDASIWLKRSLHASVSHAQEHRATLLRRAARARRAMGETSYTRGAGGRESR